MSPGGTDQPDPRVAGWVERSCNQQGVPVKITDPVTVRQLAALLGAATNTTTVKRRADRGVVLEVSPGRDDPLDVETARALGPGVDGREIEDGLHDCVLATQVEVGPLGA